MPKAVKLFLVFVFAIGFNGEAAEAQNNASQTPASAIAAEPAEAVKFKTFWLEQILKDTENLQLSENRAKADARIASLYWNLNRAKARQLFRQSIDALLAAKQEIELNRKAEKPYALYRYNYIRQEILRIIVKRDEKLAFETFLKSRPSLTAETLAGIPLKTEDINLAGENWLVSAENIVNEENTTEDLFKSYSVESNPNRVIEILRRDLQSGSICKEYRLLKEFHQKNPATAREILQAALARLLKTNFAQNPECASFTEELLSDSLPPLYPSYRMPVEPSVIHQLAEKSADYLIQVAAPNHHVHDRYFLSELDEILPERAEELNQKVIPQIVPFKGSVFGFSSREYLELMQDDVPPEKALSRADSFRGWERRLLYVKAASQIADRGGDLASAKKILADHFPDAQELSEASDEFIGRLAYYAQKRGDYDKAFVLIEQITGNSQIFPLVELAETIHKQTPNDSARTQAVLAVALSKINVPPATLNDFIYLGRFLWTTAAIEPEKAFALLEIVVSRTNDINAGRLTLYGSRNLLKEDIPFNGYYNFESSVHLKNFMTADAERTMKILSRFERPDARISAELLALESVSN
ncbi:MAG: hypothetical protein ACR2N3_18165 [Pyrinomonadaceae bacterium]